jgi:hypothetical protein
MFGYIVCGFVIVYNYAGAIVVGMRTVKENYGIFFLKNGFMCLIFSVS